MKANNLKVFPVTAILTCMLMIGSFAADRQLKSKKPPVNGVRKTKAKADNNPPSPILTAYILQIWRT